MTHELLKKLGIENAIMQGPMGGGPSTPELVAAVSNAGGLGSLGAAYLSPDQLTDAIRRIRALTDRPFQVNLFVGGWRTDLNFDPAPMLALLAEIHATLGLAVPTLPQLGPDPYPAQLEAVLDARPPSSALRSAYRMETLCRGLERAGFSWSAPPRRLKRRAC